VAGTEFSACARGSWSVPGTAVGSASRSRSTTDTPKVTVSRRLAPDDLALDELTVVYPGDKAVAIGDGIRAVGLTRLIRDGQSVSVRTGYRKYLCHHHVIFHRSAADSIEVVRVLHESMNMESYL